MEIQEGNKIIADFLGDDHALYKVELTNISLDHGADYEMVARTEWFYHKHLDWLKPAIQKLESIIEDEYKWGYERSPLADYIHDECMYMMLGVDYILISTDAEAVQKELVDVIQHYNKFIK